MESVQTLYYIVLIPMVYAAFAVFFVGTAVQSLRIAFGLRAALKSSPGPEKPPKFLGALADTFFMPSVLREKPLNGICLILFHASFFLLILGHLELIGEIRIFQIVEHRVFLGGGTVGLLSVLLILFFLFRRFHAPIRQISVPEDYYVLILLFLAVLFGSQLHLARRLFDYTTIGVVDYRAYLSSMILFRPALPEIFKSIEAGHGFLLVLHVFFANLFLMFFPFSKFMHACLAYPLNRLKRR
jgi:nitrate reductase gamma subunit